MLLQKAVLAVVTIGIFSAAMAEEEPTLTDPFDETQYITIYQLLPKLYKMTPEQHQKFDALLDRLTLEYHDYLATKAEEVDQLRLEYFDMQADKAAGKTVPRAKQQALHARRKAILEKSPIWIENVKAETEKFLTPQQIAAAYGNRKLPTTQPTTTQATTQPATTQPTTQPATKPVTTQPAGTTTGK